METAQQSLSQIQEEKDRLVRERNEQVRILEEDNRKQQAKYEQQLEEIETRSKRTVEEKEKLREEKDHLVRERNERVRMLEEDNRKRQAEYEQQLEEIETRSKRTVEEKEKILREKDILINQKDLLLSQQNLKLSSMSKDEKLYKEQIGILTSEQQKTTQEIKSKEDYSSLCKMYEAWQKELISQNSYLSSIQDRLVLGIWEERDWKIFMENFNQVYPGFLTHLTGSFDLAEREIRIVCLA